MNIVPNSVFTTRLDTRDYAIKLLMDYLKKSITSSDIPTNLISIKHPKSPNTWIILNNSKKIMYEINTLSRDIKKVNYNEYIKNLNITG